MTTKYLGIVPADIESELNPLGDENLFEIGYGDDMYPPEEAERRAAYWDDYVMSRLPEKYRRMGTQCNGERLVDYAKPGQTDIVLGLVPAVEDSVVLYKNFMAHAIDYRLRSPSYALPSSEYLVNGATGEITLASPLQSGDSIIADYKHQAMSQCLYLKKIALNLIKADILEQLASRFGNAGDRADEFKRQAYGDLERLKRGECGIQVFDELKLVDELETRNASNTIELSLRGGYL